MRRREFVAFMGVPLAYPGALRAQSPRRHARVALLNGGRPESVARERAVFLEGLKTLGWVEKENLMLDERSANARTEDLPRLAAELLATKPDIIVCIGPAPAIAMKEALRGDPIPVVFISVADPIGIGLAKSLGRPEGNFTGLATMDVERLLTKQVELLREIVPRATRIAFLTNPGNPVHIRGREFRLKVAREQGLSVVEVQAKTRDELVAAFSEAALQKASFMYLSGDPLPLEHRTLVAELALKHRLPVMYLFQVHVDAGGLMSYGTDSSDLHRRAANYVDKVLRGASPRDLPIEEPTKYQLVINLKTARALGLTIPQSVLLRADRVIE